MHIIFIAMILTMSIKTYTPFKMTYLSLPRSVSSPSTFKYYLIALNCLSFVSNTKEVDQKLKSTCQIDRITKTIVLPTTTITKVSVSLITITSTSDCFNITSVYDSSTVSMVSETTITLVMTHVVTSTIMCTPTTGCTSISTVITYISDVETKTDVLFSTTTFIVVPCIIYTEIKNFTNTIYSFNTAFENETDTVMTTIPVLECIV